MGVRTGERVPSVGHSVGGVLDVGRSSTEKDLEEGVHGCRVMSGDR